MDRTKGEYKMSQPIEKEKMEKVVRKIRKALALAHDNARNPEESHNALLKAQALMAEYGISNRDVNIEEQEEKNVVHEGATKYTRLQWWMKNLGGIVADNFKCYCYTNKYNGKSQVVFLGLENDVEIAKAVYSFAYDSIRFFSDDFIKRKRLAGDRAKTMAIKNDYISGYLQGLSDKFKEQIEKEQWGLILVKDALVVQENNNMNYKKAPASRASMAGNSEAREKGYKDGKKFNSSRNRGIEG
jgi:hypothetical protein